MKTVRLKWIEGKPEFTEEGGFPFVIDIANIDEGEVADAKEIELLTDYDEFNHYCRTLSGQKDTVLMRAITILGDCVCAYGNIDAPSEGLTLAEIALDKLRQLATRT